MHVQMSRECAGVPAVGDDELSEHGGSWQLGKAAVARRIESVEQRQLKLFISSPFKDMQRERDLILKIVMPKLRKMCYERDLSLTVVDLRWGVTAEQSEQSTALLLCLRELESSSLFVGMLGERYGYSPGVDAAVDLQLQVKSLNQPKSSHTHTHVRMHMHEEVGRRCGQWAGITRQGCSRVPTCGEHGRAVGNGHRDEVGIA